MEDCFLFEQPSVASTFFSLLYLSIDNANALAKCEVELPRRTQDEKAPRLHIPAQRPKHPKNRSFFNSRTTKLEHVMATNSFRIVKYHDSRVLNYALSMHDPQ